jgi:hypothetical protein
VGLPKTVTWFWHGPWRFYASLTNDLSWWVDLRISRFPFAIVREAYPTRGEALVRAEELRGQFEAGLLERKLPLLRERVRRPRR